MTDYIKIFSDNMSNVSEEILLEIETGNGQMIYSGYMTFKAFAQCIVGYTICPVNRKFAVHDQLVWRDAKTNPPKPYESVLCHIPSTYPSVHEGSINVCGVWYVGGVEKKPGEVEEWAKMPKREALSEP